MFYVMDHNFNWLGIVECYNSVEINHRFYEADDLTLTIPYSVNAANLVKTGLILHRFGTKKGYIIETIEINKEANEIWIFAMGLEYVLNRRVNNWVPLGNIVSQIYEGFISNHFVTGQAATWRAIANFVISSDRPIINITLDDAPEEGKTVYEIISAYAREYNFGYKVDFDTEEKKMVFSMYLGNQESEPKIRWLSKWGHLFNDTFIKSIKDYKNIISGKAGGDGANLVTLPEDNGTFQGFNRIETFISYSDLQEKQTMTQTERDKLQESIRKRMRQQLVKLRNLSDFSFTLSNEISDKFGESFNVGDKVYIYHNDYNFTQTEIIETVKETIIEEKSEFEIIFRKQEA